MHESVERLLQCARKSTGNREMTYSELASRLAVSPAVMTNWKARGISKEGAIKAEKAFGCTAHWILSGNHAERAPTVVRARLEGEPPPPDFTAREVSESDWAVLQDIQILPNEEREKLLNTIRAEAAKWKSLTDELIAKRMASTDRVTVTDRLLGGESQMGDLDTGTHK